MDSSSDEEWSATKRQYVDSEQHKSSSGKRMFSTAQSATLTSLYLSGMRGIGKKYSGYIQEAETDTGLTTEQIKVRIMLFIRT